jgi:hypothetical protein
MDDAAQWRLYRSSFTCARRLSSSAVLLQHVIQMLRDSIVANDPLPAERVVVDLHKILAHVYDGVRESQEVMPVLETFAQAMVSRQVELPSQAFAPSTHCQPEWNSVHLCSAENRVV